MEQLQQYLPKVAQNEEKRGTNVCIVNNSPVKITKNENGVYFSAYNDEKATPEQINEILKYLFAVFNHTQDEQIAIISAVTRNEMTLKKIKDSVNNLIDNFKFGSLKPLPADVVKFDKQNEEIEIFNAVEVYKIAKGAARYYYDHNTHDVIMDSAAIYDRSRKHYFETVRNEQGEIQRDSKGLTLYTFTTAGKTNSGFLKQFLLIQTETIEYRDKRIFKI